jgi:hypothetical protein
MTRHSNASTEHKQRVAVHCHRVSRAHPHKTIDQSIVMDHVKRHRFYVHFQAELEGLKYCIKGARN